MCVRERRVGGHKTAINCAPFSPALATHTVRSNFHAQSAEFVCARAIGSRLVCIIYVDAGIASECVYVCEIAAD
jgi:hypothetical protein